MDIMAFAKRARFLVCQPVEGDTFATFCRRCREMSLNKMSFWQAFCCLLKRQIRAALKSSLKVSFLVAFVCGVLLTYFFVYASPDKFTATAKADLPKPEISRGPPKRFVPLPDAEIGGCARSDSTVPAI